MKEIETQMKELMGFVESTKDDLATLAGAMKAAAELPPPFNIAVSYTILRAHDLEREKEARNERMRRMRDEK